MGEPEQRWSVCSEGDLLVLFDATFGDLYRRIARLTRDRAIAEDVVQETFFRLARAARAGTVTDIGFGWLVTTARRLYLDTIRARARDQARVEQWAASTAPAETIDDRLADALDGLSPRERAALTLRYGDGLSVAEVADLLGTTVSATESLLQRAKRRARRTDQAR